MKKDFTKASEEHLISIIRSVEPNNWFEKVGDWFGDIGLTISGLFGNLNINSYLSNIDDYHRKILDKNNTTIKQLRKIFQTVRNDDFKYGNRLNNQVNNSLIFPLKSYLSELQYIMEPGKGRFNSKEMNERLSAFGKTLDENIKVNYKYIIYIDDGLNYGSDQGECEKIISKGTIEQKDSIRAVIRKYFPNFTKKQIDDFVNKMNENGCGYAAMANTVFKAYIGREDEFEKEFGFPMFDENGNLNSHLLILDIYCFNYDGKHEGTDIYTRETILEEYMKKHHVEVNVVNNIDVTVNNFEELSKSGEIIVAVSPITLRDENGNIASDGYWNRADGGHAMVITDVVTINGKKMYKVSSWGDCYYIDPDDYKKNDRFQFQQVRY